MSCCDQNKGTPISHNCCKSYSSKDIKNINEKYSIVHFNQNNQNMSNIIKTYFITNPLELQSLLDFYNSILKAEKYGNIQAHIGWGEVNKRTTICGDMCFFKKALIDKGDFYTTINAAIQYDKWLKMKNMYDKRGLYYCVEFEYSSQ
tara:strand:+ start:1950 stop:2390 length:441 start_codon:yes stop_codon:yes gene_type:complete